MLFPDPVTAPKAGKKVYFKYAVGDRVQSAEHLMGFKDPRCYNDIPKGSIGHIVKIRHVLDQRNPSRNHTQLTVDFEIEIDSTFKERYGNDWKRWYPRGSVAVRHQVTNDTILPYRPVV